MDTPDEVRWRLRNQDHIVGYERHVSGRIWSSSDGLWWRGERLNYTSKDRCFMVKDVNNEWLYEGDLVSWNPTSGLWRLLHTPRGWRLSLDGFECAAPAQNRVLRREAFSFVK